MNTLRNKSTWTTPCTLEKAINYEIKHIKNWWFFSHLDVWSLRIFAALWVNECKIKSLFTWYGWSCYTVSLKLTFDSLSDIHSNTLHLKEWSYYRWKCVMSPQHQISHPEPEKYLISWFHLHQVVSSWQSLTGCITQFEEIHCIINLELWDAL